MNYKKHHSINLGSPKIQKWRLSRLNSFCFVRNALTEAILGTPKMEGVDTPPPYFAGYYGTG